MELPPAEAIAALGLVDLQDACDEDEGVSPATTEGEGA